MQAASVLDAASRRGWMLATAESCTGGMVAAALTAIPGSSRNFELGVVTYSNAAKTLLLGVSSDLIAAEGAVSADVAAAMATGMLAKYSNLNLTVAVTGIAGPDGGNTEKPVGLVFIATAVRNVVPRVKRHQFTGDRHAVREASVSAALAMLLEAMAA